MKNIKIALWSSLIGLTVSWLLADTLWPQPFAYFPFRTVFVQYSGVLAIGAMSLSLLLAMRPVWLEPMLGGLDKMYRLHKWLGITALVTGVLHWWWAKGTKWMVGWGWLKRPVRGARKGAEAMAQQAWTLEQWLHDQRGLAESIGEWTFYAAAILMVLALVKFFPYKWFVKTHKLLAVGYLLLAWHTVVLAKFDYWSQPIGWVLAVLLAVGVWASLGVLFKRVGHGRKVAGRIQSLQYFAPLNVLRTNIGLQPGWQGHKAGQFAFLDTGHDAPHPFTIASAWNAGRNDITFVTKGLGDHTNTLQQTLKQGDPVTIEGPYGCFTFDDDRPRQIWIGGGIGITPFIARMEHYVMQGGAALPQVDLFHTTKEHDPAAIDLLRQDALAAGVRIHVLVDAIDGYLDGARIRAEVPQWQEASVWFCGPAGFGEALQQDLEVHGLPSGRFHQELFAMR